MEIQFAANGTEWVIQVTASSWHGPAVYTGAQQFQVSLYDTAHQNVTWSNSGSTGGSATFTDDHSASVDAVVTSRQAAGSDHVTGSLSCVPL